jgi:hypothetical protein
MMNPCHAETTISLAGLETTREKAGEVLRDLE